MLRTGSFAEDADGTVQPEPHLEPPRGDMDRLKHSGKPHRLRFQTWRAGKHTVIMVIFRIYFPIETTISSGFPG